LLCALLLVLAALAVAISPAFAIETPFSDVLSSHPYAQAIGDLAGRQIIGGFADGTFGPDRPVTRQQFAKMILLTLGMTPAEDDWPSATAPFVDMGADDPSSLYPHEYVALAALYQITKGKDATHFAPLDNISRAQVVTMVVRAAQRFYPQTVSQPGNAAASTWGEFDPTHAQNAAIAEANSLLAGLGADASHPSGNLAALKPLEPMTRGEVAQLLYNLLQKAQPGGTTPTTSPGPGDDLLHFYWTAADGWKSENLSALTGVKVDGPPVLVADLMGWAGTTALLAKGPAENLVAFIETGPSTWQVYNTPSESDRQVAGPLATWRTYDNADTREYTHVAGPSVNGDLLHFWWGRDSGSQLPFSFENVSAQTGQKVQGELAPYVTSWGADHEAEHVAARSHDNDLLVFWDVAPQHNWTVVNVSSITGRKIKDSPVAWAKYVGPGTTEDHVAAVGLDSHLLHFYWTAGDGWKAEDISFLIGTSTTLAGPVAFWGENGLGQSGFESIAVVDTSGNLLHFWRSGGNTDWLMEIVPTPAGLQVAGPISSYADATPSGTYYDHLVVGGSDGHVHIFWCERLKHDWKHVDLTALTGQSMRGPFAAWVLSNSVPANVDHLAGVAH
jgi:hypothetical protein